MAWSLESARVPFLDWSLIIMKSFLYRAGSALLGGLALISMGCQEDNEAASKEQAAKSAVTVDPAKSIPQAKSQAEYYNTNPGTTGAATGSRPAPRKK